MVGGALAILLVVVLVWVARQNQNEVELSPAGEVQESHDLTGEETHVVPSFHLAWERSKEAEARKELRVEAQEGGYLLVVQPTPTGLTSVHPKQGKESVPIDAGSHRLKLVKPMEDGDALAGVYCPFPFSFGDVKATTQGVEAPARCTVSLLSHVRQAP
jgi:hypothetical protein